MTACTLQQPSSKNIIHLIPASDLMGAETVPSNISNPCVAEYYFLLGRLTACACSYQPSFGVVKKSCARTWRHRISFELCPLYPAYSSAFSPEVHGFDAARTTKSLRFLSQKLVRYTSVEETPRPQPGGSHSLLLYCPTSFQTNDPFAQKRYLMKLIASSTSSGLQDTGISEASYCARVP